MSRVRYWAEQVLFVIVSFGALGAALALGGRGWL